MWIKRVGILCAAVCMCVWLAGCGNGVAENDSRGMGEDMEESREPGEAEGLTEEIKDRSEGSGTMEGRAEEKNEEIEGELVSTGEFMDYYGMEEGEITEDYLEAFISHRQLAKGDLSELNYDVMARELYERGVTFGKKVADLIAGEEAELSEEDDFSDAAYVVMMKESYMDGTDMVQMRAAVLEAESGKVFVTDKVTDDYEAGECVRELSNGEVLECFLALRDMITEEWNDYHEVEGKEYDWTFCVVKENGDVISFKGEGPDEEFHPGLEQWCGKYLE